MGDSSLRSSASVSFVSMESQQVEGLSIRTLNPDMITVKTVPMQIDYTWYLMAQENSLIII